jgi:hypothetical protein
MPKKTMDVESYIEKVQSLPLSSRGIREPIYDELLQSLSSKGAGTYKINIPNKQPKSVFYALRPRIKNQYTNMQLKLRDKGTSLYVVVEKK